MRTEQQLREALTVLADRPQGSSAVLEEILARTAPSTIRRRRVVLVLAAVVVVLVAIGVPAVLVNRTAVPADTRSPRNWNLIHRVDLPPGWGVSSSTVTPDTEFAQLGNPAGAEQPGQSCSLAVNGPGLQVPAVGEGEPVDVLGRPGFFVEPSFDAQGGIYWRYTDSTWANMSCSANGLSDEPDPDPDTPTGRGPAEQRTTDDRELSLLMARRVVFAPVRLTLPFKLTATPDGYRVNLVSEAIGVTGDRSAGVQLGPSDPDDERPPIQITVSPGTTEAPPYLAGWESDTVNGLPAVLSARDGRLCLNTQGHTVCIAAEGGEPADLTVSLWPAGRRALLLEVADHLTLAKDLTGPRTGWNANRALPR